MDLLMHMNDIVLAGTSGDTIANGIRNFIGPIILLVMGIVSLTFLVRREITQFIIFLVIAIVVAIIFYAPGFIKSLAQGAEKSAGTKAQWK